MMAPLALSAFSRCPCVSSCWLLFVAAAVPVAVAVGAEEEEEAVKSFSKIRPSAFLALSLSQIMAVFLQLFPLEMALLKCYPPSPAALEGGGEEEKVASKALSSENARFLGR